MASEMGEYEEKMTSGHDAAHAAAQAGFGDAPYTNLSKNQDLITIVAIGMSESGGNASAVNRDNANGTVDAGYWQINQIHWGGLQESAVKDLNVNARLAYRVSGNGKNFQPWTDYKNNKYRAHISSAQSAVKSLGSESVQTGLEDIAGAEQAGDFVDATAGAIAQVGENLKAIWNLAADAGKWIGNPDNWVRIAQVTAGGAVLVVGAGMILKETDAGKAALAAATKGAVK